jgi:hypothetical protein
MFYSKIGQKNVLITYYIPSFNKKKYNFYSLGLIFKAVEKKFKVNENIRLNRGSKFSKVEF